MDDNTPEHVHQHAETSNDQHESDLDDQTHIDIAFDGLKVNFEKKYENETDDESDLDEELELEILNDEEFGQRLVALVETEEGRDLNWIPEQLRGKRQKCAPECKRECSCYQKIKYGSHFSDQHTHTCIKRARMS